MFILCSKKFVLAKIGLMRAACPAELQSLDGNMAHDRAVVVVKNTAKLGSVPATKYVPTGVLAAGARMRSALYEEGISRAWAFVEPGSLEVRPDLTIRAHAFMGELDRVLRIHILGASAAVPLPYQQEPGIIEIYPFENYFVYARGDAQFKQGYSIMPENGRVVLRMNATRVFNAGDAKESMPGPVETGVRYAYAPPRANLQSFTTGGRNSELVTGMVRNMSNINGAISAYLTYARANSRKPMQPAFYPVPLSEDGKILSALQAAGVDAFSFARWTAAQLIKRASEQKAGGTTKAGATEAVAGR